MSAPETIQLLNQAVADAASEWQRSFDAVETGLIVFDEQGRLLRLNRAAAELLGPSLRGAVGAPADALGADEPWRTARDVVRTARTIGVIRNSDAPTRPMPAAGMPARKHPRMVAVAIPARRARRVDDTGMWSSSAVRWR